MLVYLKEPMGYIALSGYRIYGRCYNYGNFGATNIPKALYIKNKNILDDATFTSEILLEKFNIDVPGLSFKISKIHLLDFDKLIELAYAFGIDYRIRKGKPNFSERLGLRKSVINHLTD